MFTMRKVLLSLSLALTVSIGFSQDTSKVSMPSIQDTGTGDVIFSKVDIESEFKGGTKSWISFLSKTLNSNIPRDNGAPKGRYKVEVSFVVDKDGVISDLTIQKDPGYGCAEEVLRVMNKSPKWKPAFQNGKFVKSRKIQPIVFAVE